jgi:hypothetical protein
MFLSGSFKHDLLANNSNGPARIGISAGQIDG